MRRVMRGGNGRFLADDLLVGFRTVVEKEANRRVDGPTECDELDDVVNGCPHRLR